MYPGFAPVGRLIQSERGYLSVRFERPMRVDGDSISTHLPRLIANQHCHIATRESQHYGFFTQGLQTGKMLERL